MGQEANKADPPAISNLAMLVARLVHQVRRFDPKNDTAKKAMDYLKRGDLAGSVLRDIEQRMVS